MKASFLESPIMPLHPLGTARQRLDPQPALPPEVARLLADSDAGAELAFLTWQILDWAADCQLEPADRARLGRLVASSLVSTRAGSTRLALTAGEVALLQRVSPLVGTPGERKPFVLEGQHLYQHRHHAGEERIVAAVRQRLAAAPAWTSAEINVALDLGTTEPALTEEQRQAVGAALQRSLGVITGGPGTGKTTIVVALVRALLRLGIPASAVALAAPTGKAAGRLDEAVERAGLGGAASATTAPALPPAQTLHRLLGYSPSLRAFAHHQQSPLPQQVVIVDEASMVDLHLMDALLAALARETALILIGDADQLPSVEAGAVFRDLAGLGVRLERSHRLDPARPHARRILELAAQVRAGDGASGALAALDVRTPATLRWEGPELVAAADRPAFLERWFSAFVATGPLAADGEGAHFEVADTGFSLVDEARLDALFAHHQRFRLLAATRGRPTGAVALNDWLHARAGAAGPQPIPGEPVIMLRNDYDRGLWNGDQGVVIQLAEPRRLPRPAAAFKVRGRWTAHTLESLRDTLALAFALTVHKAQGSEYDHVGLVLPEVPIPLVTRELLYTALTRSRQSVAVCGSQSVLEAAIAAGAVRSSGISEKLSSGRL